LSDTVRGSFLDAVRRDLSKPLPKGVGWAQTLGSLVLFGLLVQILTGILLAIYYSPSVDTAYESIRFIEERVPAGALIRGLHYWGASLVVVAVMLHALRTFLWGAYKKPRRVLWASGLLLSAVILGFGFTGYLLPWDLKAFFATRVGIRIAESLPLIGAFAGRLLSGGEDVGQLTLTRFYALHVLVLPGALLCLAGLHLALIRFHGPTPPWKPVGASGDAGQPFHPHQVLRDSVVALIAACLVVAVALLAGAPLEPKADPTDAGYVPRPEWYFYPLFQIQKFFPGSLEFVGTALIPGAVFLVLLLLPWIDRNKERCLRRRPLSIAAAAAGAAGFLALTLMAVVEDRGMTPEGTVAEEPSADSEGILKDREARIGEGVASADRTQLILEGKVLYDSLRCGLCHADPVDEEAPGIPPTLAFEGSRARESWLLAYLQKPHPMRYAKENVRPRVRMPDHYLAPGEAERIAAFLSTRRDTVLVPAYTMTVPESDSLRSEGARIFDEYACNGCHTVSGAGGAVGPDLTHAASRLQLDYIAAILRDPKGVIPRNPMTNYRLWDEELDALVAHLKTLR